MEVGPINVLNSNRGRGGRTKKKTGFHQRFNSWNIYMKDGMKIEMWITRVNEGCSVLRSPSPFPSCVLSSDAWYGYGHGPSQPPLHHGVRGNHQGTTTPVCHSATTPFCHSPSLPFCHPAILSFLPSCHYAFLPICHRFTPPSSHSCCQLPLSAKFIMFRQ